MAAATLDYDEAEAVARLGGDWTLVGLGKSLPAHEARLAELSRGAPRWDLRGVGRLDSVGALVLWRAWGRRLPSTLAISEQHRQVLERVSRIPRRESRGAEWHPAGPIVALGRFALDAQRIFLGTIALIGQLVLDLAWLWLHPREMPLREFSATLYKSGAQALPVIALIGFLIGVVLSYLSSLQLKAYGADVFIVNLLGIAIIRELGPLLVAVLVAGRSGSAMTAQLGVMRVTEEIDALATMGVSRSLRLVLPKVLALAVATPLLVVWCSAAGIFGGMVAAYLQMGLSYAYFIDTLPKVVPLANLWIGLAKGVSFGVLVGVIACYFGLHVRPNTESLSTGTTSSVVTAITTVIVVDAIFAIFTRTLGMPGT